MNPLSSSIANRLVGGVGNDYASSSRSASGSSPLRGLTDSPRAERASTERAPADEKSESATKTSFASQLNRAQKHATKTEKRPLTLGKAKREEEPAKAETTDLSSGQVSSGHVASTNYKAPVSAREDEQDSDENEVEGIERTRSASTKSVGQKSLQGEDETESVGGKSRAASSKSEAQSEESTIDRMRTSQFDERQYAMKDFMASMKKDFGIEPEEIVKAFSSMDGATLSGPPEEAANAFLSAFKFEPDQKAQAAQLYHQMVNETGAADLNEKLLTGVGQETGLEEAADPGEEAFQKLGEALDGLDKAFAKAPSTANKLEDRWKAQQAAEHMELELARLARKGEPKKAQGDDVALQVAALGADTDADTEGVDFTQAPTAPNTQTVANTLEKPTGDSAKNFMGDGGGAFSGGSSNGGNGSAKSGFANAMNSAEKKVAPTKGAVEPKAGAEGGANASAMPMDASASAAPNEISGKSAAPVVRPSMTSAEEQENVRELMKQAQFTAKKGGGEIKMDLKPEGVGQVHMKVTVLDGQVSVQMIAQNDEAKKLLEKSMHDLKSGLASHDLKLDGLKIEVAQAAQKHTDLDKQNDDQARQQARQMAQDTMSQFREERQSFQQGMMENPGWRQYGRPQSRANMSPEGVSETVTRAAAAAKRSTSGAGRLNLVA